MRILLVIFNGIDKNFKKKWGLQKEMKKDNKKVLSRYKVCYITMGMIFTIITARLIHLQVFLVDEYRDKANNNNYMNVSVSAARGDITDANGNLFATSVQSYLSPLICLFPLW